MPSFHGETAFYLILEQQNKIFRRFIGGRIFFVDAGGDKVTKKRIIAAAAVMIFLAALFSQASLFYLNTTGSIPTGLYLAVPTVGNHYRRGDIVVYEVTEEVKNIAEERQYIKKNGNRRVITFMKHIGALPGDYYLTVERVPSRAHEIIYPCPELKSFKTEDLKKFLAECRRYEKNYLDNDNREKEYLFFITDKKPIFTHAIYGNARLEEALVSKDKKTDNKQFSAIMARTPADYFYARYLLPKDNQGRKMPVKEGVFIVGEKEFLPIGEDEHSFDGRYTGTVPLANIKSRVIPLITKFPIDTFRLKIIQRFAGGEDIED